MDEEREELTDTERLDFLQRQVRVTKWVGYDVPNGHGVWPVYAYQDIRREIDRAAMAQKREAQRPK